MVSINRLSTEKRAQIIGCLTEGMSIRSTVRITGAAKNTITKLLVDLGDACSAYQHATLCDLTSVTFECDEIWNFVGMKDKNIPAPRQGETASAACGHGQRSARTRSSSRLGSWASAPL